MQLDPQILREISGAFYHKSAEDFRRLLMEHPAYLRWENGTDHWMKSAAQDGRIDLLEVLVELGMDVNEAPDKLDPNKPPSQFFQAEGPILQAASHGHIQTVRWLLDRGARINFVVHGAPRCFPLLFAAGSGHLDIVKLLVESGADLTTTPGFLDPATHAEDTGHYDVRDYLRSVGLRTLRETTPPDYPSAHAQFLTETAVFLGPLDEWRLELPGLPQVVLQHIPINEKSVTRVVFTVGLSDRPLPRGRDESFCTELRLLPSSEMPLPADSIDDPDRNWPLDWLRRIVEELRVAPAWPADPVLFMNGDPPQPLAPGTKLCGWMCLKAEGQSVQAPDFRWLRSHVLFPIYAEEAKLIREAGVDALLNRLESLKIPLHINPHRPNAALEPSTEPDV